MHFGVCVSRVCIQMLPLSNVPSTQNAHIFVNTARMQAYTHTPSSFIPPACLPLTILCTVLRSTFLVSFFVFFFLFIKYTIHARVFLSHTFVFVPSLLLFPLSYNIYRYAYSKWDVGLGKREPASRRPEHGRVKASLNVATKTSKKLFGNEIQTSKSKETERILFSAEKIKKKKRER